jgi:hypothetical protein
VLQSLLGANWIGTGSSLLIRRAVFDTVGGFDSSLRAADAQGAEDLQICLQAAERAEFRVVPRYLVGYRFSPNGMSRHAHRMFRSIEIVLGRAGQRHPGEHARIGNHLQEACYWFAWRALAGGQVFDAARLALTAIGRRPIAAILHFSALALETLKGRLRRGLGIGQRSLPLYTEATW